MTGDEIFLISSLKTKKLDSLIIKGNVFIIEKDTLSKRGFNQIKGGLLRGSFRDGKLYDINIIKTDNDKSDINITMTLTTPGCSMGSYMAEDIKMKLSTIDGINNSEVNITFDPPWKPDMMNDQAREKLGFPIEEKSEEKDKDREWE